jgi:CheY-like chemotaxis protein
MKTSVTPYALVVDNDSRSLIYASDILEEAGYLFYEAGNGDEAVEILEDCAEHVTLLFSEIAVSGGRGGLALAQIVAERWPHIKIVLASELVEPDLSDMPKKATFMPKPFTKASIFSHVRNTVSQVS